MRIVRVLVVLLRRTGKLALPFFLTILVFIGATSAQMFDSETDIAHQVKIPEGILKQLEQKEIVQSCIENSTQEDKFSAQWFQAAKIDLNGDNVADYIVKSKKDCIYGPRAASWWIFKGTGSGFKDVFDESVMRLNLQKTKTAGLRDIVTETVFMNIIRNTWKFDGKKYKITKTRTTEPGK